MISIASIRPLMEKRILMQRDIREQLLWRILSTKSLVLFLSTYLVATLIGQLPQFAPIGLGIQDALIQMYPSGHAEYTKVVGIEQSDYKSIFGGQSPLSPLKLQEIIDKLLQYKPAVLAIDLDTSDPRFKGVLRLNYDEVTKVVWARNKNNEKLGVIAGDSTREPRYSGVAYYPSDFDGKAREFPRFVKLGSREEDTFHWAITKAYCENRPCVSVERHLEGNNYKSRLRIRERKGMYLLLGNIWKNTLAPPDDNIFRNRIVILGGRYTHHDLHATSLGLLYGVDAVGQAVESELTDDRIFEPPSWIKHTLKVILGLLIVGLNCVLRPLIALAASVLVIGSAIFSATVGLFYLGTVWLDLTIFFIAILVEQIVQGAEVAQHMLEMMETELSKVILEGYVLVSDSDLAAVKNELANHIQLTRQEEGCLVFEVSQDNKNMNQFNIYEEFVSKDAFKLHQLRLSSTEWGKVSSRLEKHYKLVVTTNMSASMYNKTLL